MLKLRFLREEKAFIFDVFKVIFQGTGKATNRRFKPVRPVEEAITQASMEIKGLMISMIIFCKLA